MNRLPEEDREAEWAGRQRRRWAQYRQKTGRGPVVRIPRAVWGEAVAPVVTEAPYPRGFHLERDAFAVAYRAFWELRP